MAGSGGGDLLNWITAAGDGHLLQMMLGGNSGGIGGITSSGGAGDQGIATAHGLQPAAQNAHGSQVQGTFHMSDR